MKLTETNIVEIESIKDLDSTKVDLANRVISGVQPLLDEVYQEKAESLRAVKEDLENKRRNVNKEKQNLEKLVKELSRRRKEKTLVERIEKLVNSGLAEGGSLKHQIIVLLKTSGRLPEDKLDTYLRETLGMISKRFTKSY